MKISSTDCRDKYRMPAEYEKHQGTIIIWPQRPGSWIYEAVEARKAFANVIAAIAKSELVYVLAGEAVVDNAKKVLSQIVDADCMERVKVVAMETDDAWARDVGPTFVVDKEGNMAGIDWQFNAWGGEFDGLYASWNKDDKVAAAFCQMIGSPVIDAHPFVLEGGSIHSDGEGTLIVTKACLLSGGRNPKLSQDEIENTLKDYLGVKKVIWLPSGIYNDETNEHVDNVCAYVGPAKVVLAWTDDESDPQYAMSMADYEMLINETDALGRKFEIIKLPIPKKPVTITEYELAGFEFEEGEDQREAGERLAASYVNFYITNDGVVVPQFGDDNDSVALDILGKCFPDRSIYPVYARDIIVGGGNIHCITQQIPWQKA